MVSGDQVTNPNPFTTDGGPRVRRAVTVFLDILGYRAEIEKARKEGRQQAFLQRLRHAFDDAYPTLNDKDDFNLGRLSWATKAFTDNIVLGYPVTDDGESEMGQLFDRLGFFQLEMIRHGYFVRGALAIGDLYIDDDIVFGDGLIEAYDGENRLARDPRIVLTSSATNAVTEHLDYYSEPSRSPQNRDLLRDADRQVFIHYLDTILVAEDERGPFFDILIEHKHAVERKLNEHASNPPVWSKYLWVARYHNWFCDQHEHFDDGHKIDAARLGAEPTHLVP